MCIHQRFVHNRYVRTSFLSKCGKCKACQQEKAYKRSSRIKSEYSPDKIVLFVTLTYDRSSCPYVKRQDLDAKVPLLNVYREHCTRKVRVHTSRGLEYLDGRKYGSQVLGTIIHPDYTSFDYRKNIAHLKFRRDSIGVCFYPDLQNFKKRLSINLKRNYNYEIPTKVFATSEYGSTTSRPHFHLLFFIRPHDEQ